MSLQFVFGFAGTGKTTYFLDKILETGDDKQIFYIVPEPIVFSMQKMIMNYKKVDGLVNIEVLSFEKLIYRILEEAGCYRNEKIDKTAKCLLITKILLNLRGLKFINGRLSKNNIEELVNLLDELIRDNIGIDELENSIAKITINNKLLLNKVSDIKTIYSEYLKYTDNLSDIPEQNIGFIKNKIKEVGLIDDAIIFIDEFYKFSAFQIELIKELANISSNIYISLLAKGTNNEASIKEYCNSKNIKIDHDILLFSNKRHENYEDLLALESNFLSNIVRPYDGIIQNIDCSFASNPYDEIENVGNKIIGLISSHFCNFNDIGVLYCNSSLKEDIIKGFSNYNISVSYEQKESIREFSLIDLITIVYEVIVKDFDYESIMKYLRTNCTNLDMWETDFIDNYLIKYGISGYEKWVGEDWIFTMDDENYSEENIKLLNDLKSKVITPFVKLKSSIDNSIPKNVKDYTESLYNFLYELNIEEVLNCKYNDNIPEDCNKEIIYVWNNVIGIFDRIINLLGDQIISIEEYINILNLVIDSTKIDKSSDLNDSILLEDISKAAIIDKKVIFLLGVNDGYIPEKPNNAGLVNIEDREELEKLRLKIGGTYQERIAENELHIYSQIMKACQKIYISYSKQDKQGENLNPSIIIGKIKRILKNININKYEPCEDENNVLDLQRKYELSKETIEKLYPNNVYMSASRLQDYAMCPFKFFIKHNLNLKEKQIYKLQSLDIGQLYHAILEAFFEKIKKENVDINSINTEYVEFTLNELVKAYTYKYDIFGANERYKFITSMLKSVLLKSLEILLEHIRKGKFIPTYFEITFDKDGDINPIEIPIKKDKKVIITGKIDRIDVLEEGDKAYIKIIDYKSGNTSFDLKDVYNNINLQLLLYVIAVSENKALIKNKEILPGGVLYFHLGNKKIKLDDGKEENIEEKIAKKYRMSGLILANNEVAKNMDNEFEKASKIIPVELKKDGEFSKNSSIATEEEFITIKEKVKKNISEIGQRILSGDVEAKPYRDGTMTACDYCEYKAICNFIPNRNGFEYRQAKKGEPI